GRLPHSHPGGGCTVRGPHHGPVAPGGVAVVRRGRRRTRGVHRAVPGADVGPRGPGRGMSARRILFHRDFRGQTGGHGKVWNYFHHALALGLDARVYLTDDALRDETNPWMQVPGRIEADWR